MQTLKNQKVKFISFNFGTSTGCLNIPFSPGLKGLIITKITNIIIIQI